MRAFDDLVRQGKVHYVGVSEWTAEQIADALRLADEMGFDRIVSNQPQYSLHLAGDRGRGRPAVREGGRRPDRLVAARPGRADRASTCPGGVRPAGGLASHGAPRAGR